jgi:hypothetical protein
MSIVEALFNHIHKPHSAPLPKETMNEKEMPKSTEYGDVCSEDASLWRECLENQLLSKAALVACAGPESKFEKCVAAWRASNPAFEHVRMVGEKQGEPPVQCAAHSCLVEKCLHLSSWNMELCKNPMTAFKKCVTVLHLSPYVT